MAQASNVPVSGNITATGRTPFYTSSGGFNMSLSGFGSATVRLERSFDEGVTWVVAETFTNDAERRVDEPEVGVYYSFNCTIYSSGTIAFRLGSARR